MSNIQLPATLQNAKVDTFTRSSGGDTLHMQSFVSVDPNDGHALASGLDITTAAVSAANSDLFSVATGTSTYFSVQLTGTWVGTVTFQASNDNSTWYSTAAISVGSGAYVNTATAVGMYYIPATGKYIRARVTAYTSGSVTASAFSCTDVAPFVPATIAATQSGTWNIATVTTVTGATLAAGTNLAADVAMGVRATTTNSSSRLKVISAATTNATSVKATAGRVYGYQFSNTTAAYKYVKLHNLATAPTVGTTAVIETIAIPPNNSVTLMNPFGVYYSAGIALSITGAAGDTDTTAVAANDVIGALIYA